MGSKSTAVKCEVRFEYETSQPQLGGNSVGIWLLIITTCLKGEYQLWLQVKNNSAENNVWTMKYVCDPNFAYFPVSKDDQLWCGGCSCRVLLCENFWELSIPCLWAVFIGCQLSPSFEIRLPCVCG